MGVSEASLTHQHLLLHFNSHFVGHINGGPQINIDFWRLDANNQRVAEIYLTPDLWWASA